MAGARLVHSIDTSLARARHVASSSAGCVAGSDWRELLHRTDIDAVVIATPQDAQVEIARAAISAGIHVLVEKPAARHVDELLGLPQLAADHNVRVRVGFNHRYHRAFQQARRLVDSGLLGPLLFLRARYGHGGRLGYEGEWRAQPQRSGGGELIDQGVHLIDLARWFLGEFVDVTGFAHTYFWDMPVEDNGFMLLKTATQQAAFMHVSCTEWKNTFSWELYGREGKLQVEGLGGSYGVEKLFWYKNLPKMGPPETTIWEYPMEDNSWEIEMAEFLEDIRSSREPSAGLNDAIAALAVVRKLYRESGYDHSA
ncbi:MAG: Gfo/Idh/MocA family oxidoreductase [Steroidobacteraceae bacterium]